MRMALWHPCLSIFQKVCLRDIAVALCAIGNLFIHRPVYEGVAFVDIHLAEEKNP